MAATIKIKNSSTASAVPTSSDLVQGELAVNVTDKRIFTENASGTVVELGTNPSILTLPDGSASAPTLTNDGDTNTGIFFPAADTVGITTGGTERARVDSSGNLGLGVTPSAWGGSRPAFEMSNSGAAYVVNNGTGALVMGTNHYYNGSDNRYKNNGYATEYATYSGLHAWFTAASGTAGNAITFTQAMTLDASGRLGIARTSPGAQLDVLGAASTSAMRIVGNSGASIYVDLSGGGDNYYDATNNIFRNASGTERARIDSSGNFLVGKTSENTTTVGIQARADGLFSAMKNDAVSGIFARGASNGDVITFRRDSTAVGSISVTTTATAYNTSSDYRLKDVTGSLTGYKERLLALEPKQGSWKVDGSEFRGFLAHEFANSYPSSVNGEKDAVDDEGKPQYQGMQAGSPEVIADLVAYIKELENRLSALEQA